MGLGLFKRIGHFKGDKVILVLVAFLSAFSILLVSSTKGAHILSHLTHLAFAAIGMGITYIISYKKLLQRGRLGIIILAIVLLGFTLFSSAVRGIEIGGHTVQTFYFIGLLVIIWISNFIGRRLDEDNGTLNKENMKTATFIMFLFCIGIGALNMSTAIILFCTAFIMFYIGRFSTKSLVAIAGIVIIGVSVLTALVATNKLDGIGRIDTFVNRWEYYFTERNIDGYGDQMIMSRAAIARSGFHPAGPGRGVIKNSLPENSTDYAFASLFEETGIIVGSIIIFLFIAFFYRSWIIAKKSKSAIGSLLAFGIGFWLTCQAFVHIGVNCELLPATGQTLPFVSTGGASLFVSGAAVGMLLNVSKSNEMEEGKIDARDMFIESERNK